MTKNIYIFFFYEKCCQPNEWHFLRFVTPTHVTNVICMTFHEIHFFRYTASNGFLQYFSFVLLEHMRIRLTESRKKSRQLPSLYNGCDLEFATQCARHAWHTCCSANLTKCAPHTPFVLINLHVVYANGCLQIVLHHFCLTPLNNHVSHYFNFGKRVKAIKSPFP